MHLGCLQGTMYSVYPKLNLSSCTTTKHHHSKKLMFCSWLFLYLMKWHYNCLWLEAEIWIHQELPAPQPIITKSFCIIQCYVTHHPKTTAQNNLVWWLSWSLLGSLLQLYSPGCCLGSAETAGFLHMVFHLHNMVDGLFV